MVEHKFLVIDRKAFILAFQTCIQNTHGDCLGFVLPHGDAIANLKFQLLFPIWIGYGNRDQTLYLCHLDFSDIIGILLTLWLQGIRNTDWQLPHTQLPHCRMHNTIAAQGSIAQCGYRLRHPSA